jgi:hypothetical protein
MEGARALARFNVRIEEKLETPDVVSYKMVARKSFPTGLSSRSFGEGTDKTGAVLPIKNHFLLTA